MVFLLHRCSAQFLVFSRLDKVTLLIATCQLLHNEFYLHLSMSRFNQVHFYLFIYLFLAVLGLHCCSGCSLVAESRDYSPVAAHGFLTVVPSRCGSGALEHRLSSYGAQA